MVNTSSWSESQKPYFIQLSINNYIIVTNLIIIFFWSFTEKSKKKAKRKKQLHISYHNGDHYNSVRRISDIKGPNCFHEANKPANIFIDVRYVIRLKI